MQTLIKLFYGLLGLLFSLEVIAIPISLYINHKDTALLNEKQFLGYDFLCFIGTYIVGAIVYELTNPQKRKK